MLCKKCQLFCKEVGERLSVEDSENSKAPGIRWPRYSKVLYDNVPSLELSSVQGCPVCRVIYSTPSWRDTGTLVGDANVILEMDCQNGTHPVILTRFERKTGPILLPAQMVAVSLGPVNDSKEHAINKNFCLRLTSRVRLFLRQMWGIGQLWHWFRCNARPCFFLVISMSKDT